MSSLIKDMLDRIDREVASLGMLKHYTVGARHAFIQARMESLQMAVETLTPLLGENNAIAVASRAMDRMADIVEQGETAQD